MVLGSAAFYRGRVGLRIAAANNAPGNGAGLTGRVPWGITGLQWIREQGGAGDLRFAVVAGDAACDLQRRAEMIGARMDSE